MLSSKRMRTIALQEAKRVGQNERVKTLGRVGEEGVDVVVVVYNELEIQLSYRTDFRGSYDSPRHFCKYLNDPRNPISL